MAKREYSKREITVVWESEKCIHSRVCVMSLPKVYNPKDNPWIKLENAKTNEIIDQVSKCPSGALSIKKSDLVIVKEEIGSRGKFMIFENEILAGEMTYTWAGEDKIIIDHTGVEEEYSGKGYGKKLVLRSVEFAREHGIKIIPLCTYAKSEFIKKPDYNDVNFNIQK